MTGHLVLNELLHELAGKDGNEPRPRRGALGRGGNGSPAATVSIDRWRGHATSTTVTAHRRSPATIWNSPPWNAACSTTARNTSLVALCELLGRPREAIASGGGGWLVGERAQAVDQLARFQILSSGQLAEFERGVGVMADDGLLPISTR